jgi:AcrR family transcriptional regulator
MTRIQKRQHPSARRPRNSLSKQTILEAAESLGASGAPISIRGIAEVLECSPMAVYKHFKNKDHLESELLDRIFVSLSTFQSNEEWRVALLELSMSHYEILKKKKWAIQMLASNPLPGVSVAAVGERFYEILLAFSGIIAINYGWSLFEGNRQPNKDTSDLKVVESLRMLNTSEFPLSTEYSDLFNDYASSPKLKRTLQQFINGI